MQVTSASLCCSCESRRVSRSLPISSAVVENSVRAFSMAVGQSFSISLSAAGFSARSRAIRTYSYASTRTGRQDFIMRNSLSSLHEYNNVRIEVILC